MLEHLSAGAWDHGNGLELLDLESEKASLVCLTGEARPVLVQEPTSHWHVGQLLALRREPGAGVGEGCRRLPACFG
jgi:hypothetical protein